MTDEVKELRDKWREECPEFDDFDGYRSILAWLEDGKKGEVVWADTFVDGHGRTHKNDRLAHWQFVWKFGFIGFDAFKKDDEERAKKAAAMFVWLWLKKRVPAEYAEKCAEAYAKNYTFYRGG